MKRLYKRFLNLFFKIPLKIEVFKTFIAEWYAIFAKRSLYKNIKWTKEQQREFDEFWKKNYGKKISNRWHRLYQSVNGVYRIDYMPEIIYTTKIESKFNDYFYSKVSSDKSLLGIFFDNRIEKVRTPENYVINSYGVFYNANREVISRDEAKKILNNIGSVVVKPTVDSSSGQNVQMLDIKNGTDTKADISLDELFDKYGSNFVVQEKIRPHKELKDLYPDSINTIRLTSYILDSEVHVAPISLRIGACGGVVDNIHAGGMGVSVETSGHLGEIAYRLGYGDSDEKFSEHPDTKVVFKDYKLSFIEELIEDAKKLHGILSNAKVISWDFTIDEEGNIVIVEVNLRGQGIWFPQMISGDSLFGENTGDFLKELSGR